MPLTIPRLTDRSPLLEPAMAVDCPQGLRLLERLLEQLADYRIAEPPRRLDLTPLPEADRLLVNQALGEGEVSILFTGDDLTRVQETRLTGIWRVQSGDASGQRPRDDIEIAEIPNLVRDRAFKGAATLLSLEDPPPAGVLGGRALLPQLNEQVALWRLGDAPSIVNLNLLPISEQDTIYLEQRLGRGPVVILSRGYGHCRITATALRHCWWVQHFNADDRMILNSIEVVDVPAAALAAQEDIEDSAQRLAEILQAFK